MPRNEDFDNSFWSEPEVEELSANATLLYIWSWTNLRCGMAGVYRVSLRAMTESKVTVDEIPAALEELAAGRFAFYEESVLWVRARVKRLRTRTPQIAKSIANDLAKIAPEHPIRGQFLQAYADLPWLRDALGDLRPVNLNRGSGEPHQTPRDTGDYVNVTRTSTEVPRSGLRSGQLSGSSPSSTEKVELPSEFPDELRPHLTAVYKVLRDLAGRHNAKEVAPLSLASVVMGRSRKPLVRAAYDCAAHWDGTGRQLKDVVAAYRNWLDRTDTLAGYEQLTADGLPADAVRMPGASVTPLRSRPSSGDLIDLINRQGDDAA